MSGLASGLKSVPSVTETLRRIFSRRGKPGRTSFHPRVDVTSERLCDDVIKYLAPTLEPYKGCSVIDISPGSCIWSRKLHEHLRPKCHVLMEPEKNYMDPFIKPLLQAPNSTYVHMDLSGANKGNLLSVYNEVFKEHGPVPRIALSPDDPKLRQLDTSLLVTGSLTRQERLAFMSYTFGSSTLAWQNLTNAALTNDLFHSAGLVRMLLWLPERDKALFHPHISSLRHPTTVQLALSAESTEVVGVEPVRNYKRTVRVTEKEREKPLRSRFSAISLESTRQTERRMQENGMRIPEGRKVHRVANIKIPEGIEALESPLLIRYKTLAQVNEALEALLERWNVFRQASDKVSGAGGGQRLDTRNALSNLANTMAYPQLWSAIREDPTRETVRGNAKKAAKLEAQAVTDSTKTEAEQIVDAAKLSRRGRVYKAKERLNVSEERVALFADLQLTTINLEVHCKALEEEGVDTSTLKSRLIAFQDELDAELGRRIPLRVVGDVVRLWEDWLALFTDPPALSQDRRAFEPLQATPRDYFPQSNIALIDFVPKTRDLSVPGVADRRETSRIGRELIKFLFALRSQSVVVVLERMSPNAAQDLIPLVPAMTDPRKGGRLDPRHMKVRQMSEDMVEGLAKAWMEWPFKPELWEILARSESVHVSGSTKEPLTPEAVTDLEEE